MVPSSAPRAEYGRAAREALRYDAGEASNLAVGLWMPPQQRSRTVKAFIAMLEHSVKQGIDPTRAERCLTAYLDRQDRAALDPTQPVRPEPAEPPGDQIAPLTASPNAPPQRHALVITGAAA